jgi:hypothetical protein
MNEKFLLLAIIILAILIIVIFYVSFTKNTFSTNKTPTITKTTIQETTISSTIKTIPTTTTAQPTTTQTTTTTITSTTTSPTATTTTTSTTTTAQGYSGVGVHVGDWINYSVNETGIVSSPEVFTYSEVTKIFGPNVTMTNIHYYEDKTTSIDNQTVDVSKQFSGITSANLNVGDSRAIYTGENVPLTVSQILTRTYNGVSREVVYFNYNNATYTESLQIYFDRQTGFMLESNMSMLGISIQAILNSTNLW